MEGTQEYNGGITVELKDTEEMEESKITQRTFDVSMEQVMVATCACARSRLCDTLRMRNTSAIVFISFTPAIIDIQGDSFVSVIQFHLHGWPKEGVPSSPEMMLELVRVSRQHWRETGFNLITVHTATK